ncbi:MAG: Fur family transcriptional regulator [Gammaproteobacteria bacterium]|nr:Fur family transcriptional regulator [Gammaproteobacteria bacterium]
MPMKKTYFPERQHDHEACILAGMEHAEAECESRNVRFTENRRSVLELLLADHRPLGVYEIMEQFDWKGRRPAPSQIYRALEFLESIGLVHRIESSNAYLACNRPGRHRCTLFLVCELCKKAAEVEAGQMQDVITDLAKHSGFELHSQVIEARGLCPECTHAPTPDEAGH